MHSKYIRVMDKPDCYEILRVRGPIDIAFNNILFKLFVWGFQLVGFYHYRILQPVLELICRVKGHDMTPWFHSKDKQFLTCKRCDLLKDGETISMIRRWRRNETRRSGM